MVSKKAKREASTLADKLYQATYDPNNPFLYGAVELRRKLLQARRFVLDERMARFLADLSTAAFLRKNKEVMLHCVRGGDPGCASEFMPRSRHSNMLVEQMRMAARLPHPYTWIEFDQTANEARTAELTGIPRKEQDMRLRYEGWLLEQHPQIETAFAVSIAVQLIDDLQYMGVNMVPWVLCWSTDNQPLPWQAKTMIDSELPSYTSDGKQRIMTAMSSLLCGIEGYRSSQVSGWLQVYGTLPHESPQETARRFSRTLHSYGGTMRRIWALLATINDIPVLTREVKATKGFMGRGMHRKFLDHQTIILQVPADKDMRKLARHVVACARRRAHMVRGHWRLDWRHPPNPLCPHVWTEDSVCKYCSGHRLWIHEHQRGDPTLGIIQTDYQIEHPT